MAVAGVGSLGAPGPSARLAHRRPPSFPRLLVTCSAAPRRPYGGAPSAWSLPWISIRAEATAPGAAADVLSEDEPRQSLFIFGLGYSGLGVANYFRQRGWEVAGTCRSRSKAAALRSKGFAAFTFDFDELVFLEQPGLEALAGATHVLSTCPPSTDDGQDPVLAVHAQQLEENAERFSWVGYISSTSVYGQHHGSWVNEDSELRAEWGKGFARLRAEHAWLQLQFDYGMPVHVFRCGGIYGPRRSALDVVTRRGPPSASAERRARAHHVARCHALDICRAIEGSMRNPAPGEAYNVVDDEPACRAEVLQYATELLLRRGSALGSGGGGGASASPPIGGTMDEDLEDFEAQSGGGAWEPTADGGGGIGAGSFAAGRHGGGGRRQPQAEKRVSNAKLKRDLGVRLEFPSYREGLAALAAGDLRPFD